MASSDRTFWIIETAPTTLKVPPKIFYIPRAGAADAYDCLAVIGSIGYNAFMPAAEKLPAGTDLDAIVAEAVMGWKNVRRENGGVGYVGKRPDKLGRFRAARVPPYSAEPREAAALGPRLEQLGLFKKFLGELEKSAHAEGRPTEWAPPEQLCRAALKTVGARSAPKASQLARKPARRAEALRRKRKHVSAGR